MTGNVMFDSAVRRAALLAEIDTFLSDLTKHAAVNESQRCGGSIQFNSILYFTSLHL
jgi:hypothetical protein